MSAYIDTSVLGRLLLGEPDAPAIIRDLGSHEIRVSSRLLRIELRRLAMRHGLEADALALLAAVALIPLDEETMLASETVPPSTVATLDAIHLATALRLARDGLVDTVMTYDVRLSEGAREHGLAVLAPA
jgi:predicted nucleic acid-binding protein